MNDQRSLEEQLKALAKLAIEARLYDADDFLVILRREVASLRQELDVAKAFHDVAVKERDLERQRVTTLTAERDALNIRLDDRVRWHLLDIEARRGVEQDRDEWKARAEKAEAVVRGLNVEWKRVFDIGVESTHVVCRIADSIGLHHDTPSADVENAVKALKAELDQRNETCRACESRERDEKIADLLVSLEEVTCYLRGSMKSCARARHDAVKDFLHFWIDGERCRLSAYEAHGLWLDKEAAEPK